MVRSIKKEANASDEGNQGAPFTPRRSLRIKQEQKSVKRSEGVPINEVISEKKSTPRRSVRKTLVMHESSDEDHPNKLTLTQQAEQIKIPIQTKKKKNKKSQKQKVRARQIRKEKRSKENSSEMIRASNGSVDEAVDSNPPTTNSDSVSASISIEHEKLISDEVFESIATSTEIVLPVSIEDKVEQINETLLLENNSIKSSAQIEIKEEFQEPEKINSSLENVNNSQNQHQNNSDSIIQNSIKVEQNDISDLVPLDTTYEELQSTFDHLPDASLTEKIEKPIQTPNSLKQKKSEQPRFSSTPAKNSILGVKVTPFKKTEDSAKKLNTVSVLPSVTPKKPLKLIAASAITPTAKAPKTPLKSVLKSCFSRSICDLDTTTKKNNRVIFNSPDNQTIAIDQVDFLMKSNKKVNALDQSFQNVTVRRKRSLSVAETEKEKKSIAMLGSSDENGQDIKRFKFREIPGSRVKMPNFAAIHQQSFDKMESLTDHVAKKIERAKILSATKLKSKTEQLNSTTKMNKPENDSQVNALKPSNKSQLDDKVRNCKARQKIELTNIKVAPKTIANDKPEGKSKSEIKPKAIVKDKIAQRHKKNMSLYKATTSKANNSQGERTEYIQGVRSNRRFALQMEYRDRLK